MTKTAESLAAFRPHVLLVGIHAPYNKITDPQSYFDEFLNLVKTNGIIYDETIFFKLRDIDAGTFISKGKLQDIAALCESKKIDEVIISEPLSPQQERNISDQLHCKVFDRTQLILEIFEKAAHTAEGKTQVEIALLEHKKSRLAGKGLHLSQQSGVMGLRSGFGETAKEKERRHIDDSILKLKRQLTRMHQTRETQRKQRLVQKIPLLCLVGYTNAGKSTILNALTKSNVLAEDKLFATLDTTTRSLFIDGKKKGLLSDTVGFIQLLPPHLIDAFKSTLSELQYADLLLQVIDISDPNWPHHIQVVHTILHDLELDKPMLYVFNKADRIEITGHLQQMVDKFQPHILISALDKDGLAPLIAFLDAWQSQ